MSIDLLNVSKTFGSFPALRDVSIRVEQGELVALIGPSGSGKTTLLRIVAGLEAPDHGVILIDEEDATRQQARQRRVGFVFQHYALFRHMTVFENIAFGLRAKPKKIRPSGGEIRQKVQDLLKLVQLEGLASRYPSEISGGQRQRVALARALAVEPRVMLLDEPFGALDTKVRKELRRWLRRLHDEMNITSIFVTHDQEEALELADRVVIMNKGKVEQIGTPEEVYDHPVNPFVYDFLGSVNLFHGRFPEEPSQSGVGYARPHDMEITREEAPESIRAVVADIMAIGPIVRIELKRIDGGGRLEAEIPKDRFPLLRLTEGEEVYVRPRNLKVFS